MSLAVLDHPGISLTDVAVALILWDVEPEQWQHSLLIQVHSAPRLLLNCLLACELECHLLPIQIHELVFGRRAFFILLLSIFTSIALKTSHVSVSYFGPLPLRTYRPRHALSVGAHLSHSLPSTNTAKCCGVSLSLLACDCTCALAAS